VNLTEIKKNGTVDSSFDMIKDVISDRDEREEFGSSADATKM